MNSQEGTPVVEVEPVSDAAGVLEKSNLDAKIVEVLGQSALSFLEKTLAEHLGESYKSSDLDILEKINLILILASQKKTSIPPKLQQAVKNVHAILPNGQLDISYLRHLDAQRRKQFLQVLSSLVLLLGVSLGLGKSLISRAQNAENQTRTEAAATVVDDNEAEKAAATSEFERLYSEDLRTVVAEMGWEDFLFEYASVNNEALWSPEEVFQLLRTQEPRYWGYYVVGYPQTFLKVVGDSKITPLEFMSSCGTTLFFDTLDNQKSGVSWLDLWTMEELFETLKTTTPDWGKALINNQALFVDVLTKDDLGPLVQMLTVSSYGSSDMSQFLENYNDGWDKVWSRRELLNAMKTGGFSWEMLTRRHFELFSKDLTAEEFSAIVAHISVNSAQGFPGREDATIFSEYYDLNLYKIIEPTEFKKIIEANFNAEAVQKIFEEYPELNTGELEKIGLEKLFETKAIKYVLDNYDDWRGTYSIADIMVYLRSADSNKSNYAFITDHPELFLGVAFTDEEVFLLAYGNNIQEALEEGTQFFQHFTGDTGWSNQISMDRLLMLGRDESSNRMYSVAVYFPELFLPHFTEQDVFYLFASSSYEFHEMNILQAPNALWQPYVTPEYRRKILDFAKNDPRFDWKRTTVSGYHLFEDILTFDEAKEIMSVNSYNVISETAVWQTNVTPEWEYSYFRNSNSNLFVNMVINNPSRYAELLNEEDKLVILENNPTEILRNYHFWKRSFSPEFILDYFYGNQSDVQFGSIVLENKQIFGHLFYDKKYDFKNLLTHEGDYTLFNINPETDQYYYEDWSEFASLEEIFYLLRDFDSGKNRILDHADIFFEYVEYSDLDLFMQTEYGIATLDNRYDDWQELWSINDVYKSAKNNRAGYSAATFIDSKNHSAEYIALMKPEDLNFLIDSYPDEYAYGFASDLEVLTQKWTAAEIFDALKQEHPETWGMFVTQENVYFLELVSKNDLENLVKHGAIPSGLVDYGFWETSEIFDAYKNYSPETWGGAILRNRDIFVDLVVQRGTTLEELLKTSNLTGDEIDYLHYWAPVWPQDEINNAIEKLRENTSGGQGG